MSTSAFDPVDPDEFAARLRRYVPARNIRADHDRQAVFVHAGVGGVGIPADVFDGFPWRLTESVGMDGLTPTHHLFMPDAHHALVFKPTRDAEDQP